jgi:hypothetical protein
MLRETEPTSVRSGRSPRSTSRSSSGSRVAGTPN